MFDMKLGKFELLIACDGYFKLDGGAMFGVVPKPLWSRNDPADDRNRILLSINPMVIRYDNEVILVETGIGDKWDDKNKDIMDLNRNDNLLKSLKEFAIEKQDVTGVILTHLHFDHSGGAVELHENGDLIPAFPNAKYFIQQKEWDFAVSSNERAKASYIPENFLPLEEHGHMVFLNGDQEILPGVYGEVTGGHTPHHQVIHLESEGKKACYIGDIIPTASHIKLPYIMGYDTNPLDTLASKKRLINSALDEKWLVIFPHAPRIRSGYFQDTGSGIVLNPFDLNDNT